MLTAHTHTTRAGYPYPRPNEQLDINRRRNAHRGSAYLMTKVSHTSLEACSEDSNILPVHRIPGSGALI